MKYRARSMDLLDTIKNLKERVEKLERSPRLTSSTIDPGNALKVMGTLQVFDSTGQLVAELGTGTTDVRLLSGNGETILSSASSTLGLAKPYITYNIKPTSVHSTPSVSTTSATFTPQWTVMGEYAHEKIRCVVLVQTSDGTTGGDIRLIDPATLRVLVTDTVAAGDFRYVYLDGDHLHPPTNPALFKYDVEIQRTAGAGSIRSELIYAHGWGIS